MTRNFLQQKINLKPEKKIKSCTLSKKTVALLFCIDQIADAGSHGIYRYVSESFYNVLLNTNPRLKEIYHTWYLISRENLTTRTTSLNVQSRH